MRPILLLATAYTLGSTLGHGGIINADTPIFREHYVPMESHESPDMTFPGASCFVPSYVMLTSPSKAILIAKDNSVTINYGIYGADAQREASYREDVQELGKPSKFGSWVGWRLKSIKRPYCYDTIKAYRQNEYLIVTGKRLSSSRSSSEKTEEVMRCVLLSLQMTQVP